MDSLLEDLRDQMIDIILDSINGEEITKLIDSTEKKIETLSLSSDLTEEKREEMICCFEDLPQLQSELSEQIQDVLNLIIISLTK
jgi:hypothetical protein